MSIPTRVTIHDVAREAGVSVATSARVQGIIDTLGHGSSLVARSPRSLRTNVIGILAAEFEPFSTGILEGRSSAIAGTGFELLAYSGGGGSRPCWERHYLSRLSGTLVDGAIFVTPTAVFAAKDLWRSASWMRPRLPARSSPATCPSSGSTTSRSRRWGTGQPAADGRGPTLQQMGARAIEMPVGLIEGRPPGSTPVRLPTQLDVRSSTRRL